MRRCNTGTPTRRRIDVDIDLGGRRLTGTVSTVFGDRLVSVTYSKLDGKHLLESWIPLLALLARMPEAATGRRCASAGPKRGTTPRLEGLGRPHDDAVELLHDLVAIYDAGRREPIPLPIKTSYAWAVARHSRRRPDAEMRHSGGSRATTPARTRRRRTCGPGAETRRWIDLMQPLRPGEEYDGEDNRLGAFAARALAADAARREEPRLMDASSICWARCPPTRSTTVLEASAGTGKTFALAGLVTRYVAEGRATLDQMLLITFSRAASQELRERVRCQIVDAVRRFRRHHDGR